VAQPYVGELRIFAGNFAPAGWMMCEGQLLAIAENDTLYALIGTTYGGDGVSTFGLPDLRGRVPVHQGPGYPLALTGGVDQVALSTPQLPIHTHPLMASTDQGGSTNGPTNALAQMPFAYVSDVGAVGLNGGSITPIGGNQPHTNVQPYLCLTFIISLFGIFPAQA
jgi:microcystin-dependent protein